MLSLPNEWTPSNVRTKGYILMRSACYFLPSSSVRSGALAHYATAANQEWALDFSSAAQGVTGLTGIWESILDGYMKFLNLLKISLAFFR